MPESLKRTMNAEDLGKQLVNAAAKDTQHAQKLIAQLGSLTIKEQEQVVKQFHKTYSSELPETLYQLFKSNPCTKRQFYLLELASKIVDYGKRNGQDCSHDYIAMLDHFHALTASLNKYEQLPEKTEKDFELHRVEWISSLKVLRPILDRSKSCTAAFFKPTETLLTQPITRLFDEDISAVRSTLHHQ